MRIKKLSSISMLLLLVLASACTRKPSVVPAPEPSLPPAKITKTGYTIQVGAFRDLNNAVRLARSLNQYDLNAYYFKHDSGLYKVRFGDFADRNAAQKKANGVRSAGIIDEFYIVSPESYAMKKEPDLGSAYIRDQIITRAESFLGIPYQWGGTSPENGFDCSGLTMAVYNLVGLNLPRSSYDQFAAGTPIARNQLQKGDLVFFKDTNRSKVSHVGIFTGGDAFIHAPGKNKKIRIDSLSNTYFRTHYAGARTYLR